MTSSRRCWSSPCLTTKSRASLPSPRPPGASASSWPIASGSLRRARRSSEVCWILEEVLVCLLRYRESPQPSRSHDRCGGQPLALKTTVANLRMERIEAVEISRSNDICFHILSTLRENFSRPLGSCVRARTRSLPKPRLAAWLYECQTSQRDHSSSQTS